jgi:hypothetical protein
MAEYPVSVGAKSLIAAHCAISGWAIEVSVMPDEPDQIVSINDTGGVDPNPKWLLDYPTLNVLVRGKPNTYLTTFAEAKAVKDLLLGLTSTDINGDRWVSITQNGDLGFIGRDEGMRPLFSMNFALIIQPQVVTNSNRLPLP